MKITSISIYRLLNCRKIVFEFLAITLLLSQGLQSQAGILDSAVSSFGGTIDAAVNARAKQNDITYKPLTIYFDQLGDAFQSKPIEPTIIKTAGNSGKAEARLFEVCTDRIHPNDKFPNIINDAKEMLSFKFYQRKNYPRHAWKLFLELKRQTEKANFFEQDYENVGIVGDLGGYEYDEAKRRNLARLLASPDIEIHVRADSVVQIHNRHTIAWPTIYKINAANIWLQKFDSNTGAGVGLPVNLTDAIKGDGQLFDNSSALTE